MKNCPPPDARCEIKFSSYEHNLHKILQWIRLNPGSFYSPFSERWVNNIYFDTHNYKAFDGNLSGISKRTKVRYRWYGKSLIPGSGTLEVKRKQNLYGWKIAQKLENSPYNDNMSWNDIRENILCQLNRDMKIWFHENPFVVLINQYHRRYFVSHDNKIRITVDTQQRVFDQRYQSLPNFKHKALIPETLILEVKFHRDEHQLASNLIQSIPVRIGRNSKYILGLRAVRGGWY